MTRKAAAENRDFDCVGNGLSQPKLVRPPTTDYTPLAKVIRGPWNKAQQIRNFFASLNNYNVFWNRVRLQLESEAKAGKYDWLTTDNVGEYADFIDPRVRLTPEQKRAWLRTKCNAHLADLAYQKFDRLKNKTEANWAKIVKWMHTTNIKPVFADKAGNLVFTRRARDITMTINAASDNVTYTNKFGDVYDSRYFDGIPDSGGGGGGGAFNYIGVHQPTDPLPGLSGQPSVIPIMPTLPNGAHYTAHDWYSGNANSYHPCEIPAPVPTPGGAPDEYYISYTTNSPPGDDGSAGNGGQGTISAPRASLPTGIFPAGTKIFLKGLGTAIPTAYGVSQEGGFTDWDTADFSNIVFEGTAENPCWIVGIDMPRISSRTLQLINCTHTIFDNIVFTAAEDQALRGSVVPQSCNYLTFRNGGFLGVYRDQGHSFLNLNDCQFVMSYNNVFRFGGQWDGIGSGIRDWHAFRPQYGNRYLWCVDCTFSHISGDACQTGNSNYTGTQENVGHFLWYAGNEAYQVREQIFDPKSSYHNICSQNYSHDMLSGGVSANEAHLIIAQDNEGAGGGSDNFFLSHCWSIANECDGAGQADQSGIQNKNNANNGTGSANGGLVRYTAIIGNVVHGMQNGSGIMIRSSASSDTDSLVYVCFNTVYDVSSHAFATLMWQPESGTANHHLRGNISVDCGTHLSFDGGSDSLMNTFDDYNWAYDSAGSITRASGFQGTSGNNHLNENPQLTDPDNGDFAPQAAGAIDSVPEPPCIQDFENIYGISIRRDYLGNARPALANAWTAGAVEV